LAVVTSFVQRRSPSGLFVSDRAGGLRQFSLATRLRWMLLIGWIVATLASLSVCMALTNPICRPALRLFAPCGAELILVIAFMLSESPNCHQNFEQMKEKFPPRLLGIALTLVVCFLQA
jgi:hypothetical protein